MITNATDPPVRSRLDRCRQEIPAVAPLLDAVMAHDDPFEARLETPDLEIEARRPLEEGRPNRGVMKLFTVPDGPQKGQAAVFFYKKSRVPSSQDRFSYGVCLVPGTGAEAPEVQEWIHFVSTGFHPETRPRRLRRAFTFTVPE